MSVRNSLRHVAGGVRHAARFYKDLRRCWTVKEHLVDVIPDHVEQLDPEDRLPARIAVGSAVDLREADQLALLTSWEGEGRFTSLFASLREDPEINTQAFGQTYLHNDFYATPDAEIYAAMIAARMPVKIVEIGGGYSTRVARRAISHVSGDVELVVVDPEPRADIAASADTVIRKRFQDIDLETLSVDERTLLFIDSSHVISTGGDVTELFCRVIPDLPPGVLIHVHDIFLPYDYPPAFIRRLYTEEYILWALLARGSKFRVLFATHFIARTHTATMKRIFGPIIGANGRHYGGSFWFEPV